MPIKLQRCPSGTIYWWDKHIHQIQCIQKEGWCRSIGMRLSLTIRVRLPSEHITCPWSSWWAEHSTTPYARLHTYPTLTLIWWSSCSTSVSKTNTGVVSKSSASIWRTYSSKNAMLLLEMAVLVVWLLVILIPGLLRCFSFDRLALY